MNVFHHHLEAVKAAGFRDLDFCHKALRQIFKHNAVGGSEKGQDVFDEVLFTFGEFLPVFYILRQVNFVNCPEAGHLIFVHFPHVFVLDGQDDKAVGIFFKKWLGVHLLSKLTLANAYLRDNLLGRSTVDGVVLF